MEYSRQNQGVAEDIILEKYRPARAGTMRLTHGMRLINKEKDHKCVLGIYLVGRLNPHRERQAKEAVAKYRLNCGKDVMKPEYICVHEEMKQLYLTFRVPKRVYKNAK